MKVAIVVNNGNIVHAGFDVELAKGISDSLLEESISEEINESGRDEEDLTDEEYAEFVFKNGAEGGHYYCEEVTLNVGSEAELLDNKTEVETSEGDTFTYNEIGEALISSSNDSCDEDLDSDGFDDDSDDFDDDSDGFDDSFDWDEL